MTTHPARIIVQADRGIVSIRMRATDSRLMDVWSALNVDSSYDIEEMDEDGRTVTWQDMDVSEDTEFANAIDILTDEQDRADEIIDRAYEAMDLEEDLDLTI